MGRRWKWFSAVKSCLTANCNSKKNQDYKSKLKLESGKANHFDPIVAAKDEVRDQDGAQLPATSSKVDVRQPYVEIKPPTALEAKLLTMREDEQGKHACSTALASAVAAEATVVPAQASAEIVHFTAAARVPDKPKEEIAAVKIQTAFRGYHAKSVLQTLRSLERLKKLKEGKAVKQQTANTLYLMQTLARLQSLIRARRIRIKEENQALHRHLQLIHERELEKLKIGEEWDGSMQSKEQIEARIVNKYEAAIRRERTLAYAFSHQWKASSRAVTPVFSDASNPQWGWSWLERWLSARPWENHITNNTIDRASIYNTSLSFGAQAQKEIASKEFNLGRSPVSSAQKPNRPPSRRSPSTPSSSVGRKRLVSPRGAFGSAEDDSRSKTSLSSDCYRRHNIPGPSVRDDDSLTTSPSVPRYMASTESARAKSRFHTLHGNEAKSLDKVSVSSVKKRLSFPVANKQNASSLATVRRHSSPPKFDTDLTKYNLCNHEMSDQEMTR